MAVQNIEERLQDIMKRGVVQRNVSSIYDILDRSRMLSLKEVQNVYGLRETVYYQLQESGYSGKIGELEERIERRKRRDANEIDMLVRSIFPSTDTSKGQARKAVRQLDYYDKILSLYEEREVRGKVKQRISQYERHIVSIGSRKKQRWKNFYEGINDLIYSVGDFFGKNSGKILVGAGVAAAGVLGLAGLYYGGKFVYDYASYIFTSLGLFSLSVAANTGMGVLCDVTNSKKEVTRPVWPIAFCLGILAGFISPVFHYLVLTVDGGSAWWIPPVLPFTSLFSIAASNYLDSLR